MPEQPTEKRVDVVAVGAHPDDVEIGCGGTLAKLVRQGYRVAIVDLTDGEPTPRCSSPDIRRAEATAAAKALGVHERVILELPNRRLFDSFESRVALGKVFRRLKPRLVLGIAGRTPMASPDHWQAMQITDAGVFYSRLTKWDDHFDGLDIHIISAQLYYPLGFQQPDATDNLAQFVIDIGDTLETKLASVRCYKTQFPPAKAHVLKRVEVANRSIGVQAGFDAGEMFLSPRKIGATDLLKAVFPT